MTTQVLQGDCREVMVTMDAVSVDAIITDPPYGLGFMGKGWDHGVPGIEFWTAAIRVVKPGAYLLAFGGTRTFHRLVVAIEDAGWEIRDTVMWVYGSGFPKSHNGPWGGTALKPAWEPICVARKPLIGTVEANWKAHGTGALNTDGCRIAGTVTSNPLVRNAKGYESGGLVQGETGAGRESEGRWPANLIHDGSDEVLAAFPEAPGQLRTVGPEHGAKDSVNVYDDYGPRDTFNPRGDAGSAARFFYCAKASKTDRNDGLHGVEGRNDTAHRRTNLETADRLHLRGLTKRQNHHPTVKPTNLMRYLCRLVTPKGGTVLDPFAGSGSTLKAATLEGFSSIGIELDTEYCEIARKRTAAASQVALKALL